MGNQVDNKFTWVIKNFSSFQYEYIYSDQFVIGGCKWRLIAFPKGNKVNCLSLYLAVSDYTSLPCGWRRQTKFSLTIVNQRLQRLSQVKEKHELFDQMTPESGFESMFPLGQAEVYDGFLMNEEIKIVAEVDVLEVIGESDLSSSSDVYDEEQTQSLENISVNNDDRVEVSSCLLNKAPQLDECIDVNVFQALSSQLDQVKEKKKEEKTGEIRMRELEVELYFLKLKCAEMEALLEKEKVKLLAAGAPLKLDDVLEAISKFDVSDESQEATIQPPFKKIKLKNDDNALFIDLNVEASSVEESIDVPHQVDLVRRMFEKNSDIAFEFCPKNPYLRKAYISLLISLIETLCQSPHELSKEDLVGAEYALTYVKSLGYKVDWLEKMVEEVKEKKKEVQSCESQIQELEKELKEFKQRYSQIEALLEKEKAKVFAARASLMFDVPLMLDDVFLMT